jgi:hypothetical protein
MTQVMIYFGINASLLAIFAGLWALDRRPKKRWPGRRQMTAVNRTATYRS